MILPNVAKTYQKPTERSSSRKEREHDSQSNSNYTGKKINELWNLTVITIKKFR